MRAIGVLLALWGCSYQPPRDPGSPPVDSPIEIDAPMLGVDASKCFGTGLWRRRWGWGHQDVSRACAGQRPGLAPVLVITTWHERVERG